MDIDGPRKIGPYDERATDCVEAMRPALLTFLRDSNLPFIDLGRAMAALTPPAVAVGWTFEDVQVAILDLAAEVQGRSTTLNQVDPAEEHPNSYLTKH